MKKTPNRIYTDFLREIRRTRSRFLSILILSALAVAFLAGLRTTAPDMKVSADAYFDQLNLMDVQIMSTLGLTRGDVEALAARPEVLAAEGSWTVDGIAHLEDADCVVKLHALSEEGINAPLLRSGRLPEAAGECLADPWFFAQNGLKLGDVIVIHTGEGAFQDALARDTFTIVGTAVSPLYINLERGSSSLGAGRSSGFLLLPREAFALDYYTEAYLLVHGARELQCYGQDYEDLIAREKEELEELGKERAALRYQEIVADARQELNEAQEELAKAEAEAEQSLSDAWSRLQQARSELDRGWEEYETGRQTLSRETREGREKLDQALARLQQGEEEYLQARQQLEEGLAEYEQGRKELEDGQAEYDRSLARLEEGEESYRQGLAELEEGEENYQAGLAEYKKWEAVLGPAAQQMLKENYDQLTAARQQLDQGWAELEAARQQLDQGWAELDTARRQLNQGWAELEQAYSRLTRGRQELNEARQQLDQGWEEYYAGKASLQEETERAARELEEAYQKLQEGEEEYAQGLADYEQGKQEAETQLADAREQLDDARRKLDQLKEGQWYVLDRTANLGYASFQNDAQRMGNLASVFPIIFFLVAALVCLTTMTRMVEEQRLQIGCMKALGYSKGTIAVKYVGYGLFSSLIGGAAGLAVGCTLIPSIIYRAWGILYTLGKLVIPFYPLISALSIGAAVATVTLAALAACFSTLMATPAQLMRPKSPPPGKRVLLERLPVVWKRLSFIQKITVRNLFRYKKRFWMTVLGIAGCTALMVAGFGLRDSIFDIINLQFDKIDRYSGQITLDGDISREQMEEVARALDQNEDVVQWGLFAQSYLTVQSDVGSQEAVLVAEAGDHSLTDYIRLARRQGGEPVSLGTEGAVITEKLAQLLGVSVGDTILLKGDSTVRVKVTGITEHYILHYVYLSREAYQNAFGEAPQGNLILAQYGDDARETSERVSADILALDGVTGVSRIVDSRVTAQRSMQSVNYAVIVVTVSAAALAFVVLYNLTNINITERQRELASLKVLGFYDRELSAYVFRENSVLTVFGIVLGLVMGKYLHRWLIGTVEIDLVMFGRTVHPSSYVLAAGLTALFTLVVNGAASARLKKIDMAESLKTVE